MTSLLTSLYGLLLVKQYRFTKIAHPRQNLAVALWWWWMNKSHFHLWDLWKHLWKQVFGLNLLRRYLFSNPMSSHQGVGQEWTAGAVADI